jgi:DNA-binding NarL/FixJ family response regulator
MKWVGGMTRLVIHLDIDSLQVPPDFTSAERDVLTLVMEGLSNEEIAARRACSPRTVANQLAAMLRKAGVYNRTELVAACTRNRSAPSGTAPVWGEFVAGRWRVAELERANRLVRCVAEESDAALSREEQQIVEEAAQGTPNKLLAADSGLGQAAATKRLARALRKLGVLRRTQLPVLRAVFA